MFQRKSKILDPIVEEIVRDSPGLAYKTLRNRTRDSARERGIGVVNGQLVRQSVNNLVKANRLKERLELRGEYEVMRYYIIQDGAYNQSGA